MGILGHIIKTAVSTKAKEAIIRTVEDAVGNTIVTVGTTIVESKKQIAADTHSQKQIEQRSNTGSTPPNNPPSDNLSSPSCIRVPASASNLVGRNVHEVQDEFIAYGFTNIVLLPHKDLINGWLTKDGEIESVSINGEDDFGRKAKYLIDARIVIKYHTYRDR